MENRYIRTRLGIAGGSAKIFVRKRQDTFPHLSLFVLYVMLHTYCQFFLIEIMNKYTFYNRIILVIENILKLYLYSFHISIIMFRIFDIEFVKF